MLFLVLVDLAALQLHSALATQHPARSECSKGGASDQSGASYPHGFASKEQQQVLGRVT